jgi:ABC-2 type transport system ATP-binding protein
MGKPIRIEDLVVTYASRSGRVDALRGVSLEVGQGCVVGFLGPNGSGKTTTIHVLLGFARITSGQAFLFDQDVGKSIARRRIGYLPENPDLYKFLTGRELLTMAGRLFGLQKDVLAERIGQLVEQVDLANAIDRRIATYSRGMMQRIGLAQALINDPDLVILDEPTGGLDPLGRMQVRGIIEDLKARGKTVFFSSHELSEVELVCDEIVMLVDGQIAARGAIDELVDDASRLEQYFLNVVKQQREKARDGVQ